LGQRRKRSDTVSTTHSDSHDQKKEQIARDTRGDIITIVYVAEYVKFHCISLISTALVAVVARD
jgi:hypothetical protein